MPRTRLTLLLAAAALITIAPAAPAAPAATARDRQAATDVQPLPAREADLLMRDLQQARLQASPRRHPVLADPSLQHDSSAARTQRIDTLERAFQHPALEPRGAYGAPSQPSEYAASPTTPTAPTYERLPAAWVAYGAVPWDARKVHAPCAVPLRLHHRAALTKSSHALHPSLRTCWMPRAHRH